MLGGMFASCGKKEDGNGSGQGALTWGDLSKMTEDELLEFAREHKELTWYHTGVDNFSTGEYFFHVYTDSTGNSVDYESIDACKQKKYEYAYDGHVEIKDERKALIKFNGTTEGVIYNSHFSGLKYEDDGDFENALFFRTGENLNITLDNIGDAGVEID